MSRLLAIAAVTLALAGCSVVPRYVAAAQGVTDRLVARAGDAADAVMDALDEAEDLLVVETARVRAARCLNTLPSIRRYALSSPQARATIERDCGVRFEDATVELEPPPPGATEP